MKIDLIGLKEGKNRIHLEEASAALNLPGDIVPQAPVRIDGDLMKQSNQLILKVDVSFSLETECSRCLEPFQHSLLTPLERYYHIGGGETVPEEEGGLINIPENQQHIDLTQTVRETIMLNIPIKPLCQEDCKGLCPRCGANLNTNACQCMTRQTDSRWAALKSLQD